MGRFIDLTNKRFGRLFVEQLSSRPGIHRSWHCLCDCGVEKDILGYHLRTGHTQSCGCLNREVITTHGQSKTLTYQVWNNMKNRCQNPDHPRYKDWGGRGITVCDKWQAYEGFFEDMGERPSQDLSIDRIDNDLGYYKENCQWGTEEIQSWNRRSNKLLEYNGIQETYHYWEEQSGIPARLIGLRIRRGWSPERALTTPIQEKNKK